MLDQEWRKLAYSSNDIMTYWRKVFLLKNFLGKIYFPNICLMILILPFSNASVERLFSDLKNIKTLRCNKLKIENRFFSWNP